MVIYRMTLASVVMLFTTAAVSAQLTFKHNAKKDPYRDVFAKRAATQKTQPPVTISRSDVPQKPSVVCGTLIVPADPTIDPKIRVGPPDNGVDYSLRIIKPPICK